MLTGSADEIGTPVPERRKRRIYLWVFLAVQAGFISGLSRAGWQPTMASPIARANTARVRLKPGPLLASASFRVLADSGSLARDPLRRV